MAQLWTEIIDPATLTGYLREGLADYEARQGQLATYLPNREVPDVIVRFVAGRYGLTPVASFRAFDAEPEIGTRGKGKRHIIELPPIGQQIPIGEYEQLRMRNRPTGSDDGMLNEILNTTGRVVRSVSDALELQRGVVLATGKATVDQDNFGLDEDFGRDPAHSPTAGTLWSDPDADRLGDLEMWADQYEETNGERPGSIVLSRPGIRALAAGTQFQVQLLNGGARPATEEDVAAILSKHHLPAPVVYSRRVNVAGVTRPVLPVDRLLMLPAPVATDDWESTQLGATFWGQTLSSTEPTWQISPGEQPGIVAAVFRETEVPMVTKVVSDGIALPVLANANLSLAARIL